MGKPKLKICNWKLYNQALVHRGLLTTWVDEQAIKQWHYQTPYGRRRRCFHYCDWAIETTQMLKGGQVDGCSFAISSLELYQQTIQAGQHSVPFAQSGAVAHLVVDATGLKVYGEDE